MKLGSLGVLEQGDFEKYAVIKVQDDSADVGRSSGCGLFAGRGFQVHSHRFAGPRLDVLSWQTPVWSSGYGSTTYVYYGPGSRSFPVPFRSAVAGLAVACIVLGSVGALIIRRK